MELLNPLSLEAGFWGAKTIKNMAKTKKVRAHKRDTLPRTFDSISKASEATGIARPNISAAANGRRKTAGGYQWELIP